MGNVCPYCKGKKFLSTGYKEVEENGHLSLYPYTEPCYCSVNKSIDQKFGLLSGVGDAHPKDAMRVYKLIHGQERRNLWFIGNERPFLYLAKSYILSIFNAKKVMVLEGGTIVEKYNTVQPSGDWLSTSYLNQYDLLIILLTTSASYPSLQDCVLEVVKNRSRLSVSTWVYSSVTSENLKECHEFSEGLKTYLDDFKKVGTGTGNKFIGYKPLESYAIQDRNALKANEMAGDFS